MKIINTEYDNVQVSQGNIDEILKWTNWINYKEY
jgi:hypothetical protein